MVYILYADGLEEIEAVTIADILRRAQIPMQTVGLTSACITGAHGLVLQTDITADRMDLKDLTAVVLPGGLDGVAGIEKSGPAMQALQYAYTHGKIIGAICAAPTLLGRLGWLNGIRATCYPGMEDQLGGAVPVQAEAVFDGQFVTGRAPGAAMAFALRLTEVLKDRQTAELVARFLVYGQ